MSTTSEAQADKYITEMIDQTGCSVKFLNEAKPMIVKMFRDTEGSALDACLKSITATIKSQASIEQATFAMKKRASTSTEVAGDLVATPA